VDWLTSNVYWADGGYNLIGVVPEKGNQPVWKAIVDTKTLSPQDVAVDPIHR